MAKGSDSGSKGGIKNFVKDMALGAAAGATVDAFLEISHAPGVNDPSPLHLIDPQESNAETILYGASLLAATLGLIDLVGGRKLIPGFGRELLPYGIGVYIGVQTYENEIIKYLGIRDTT